MFTGLVFGSYSVTVKNANGCISTSTPVTLNNANVPLAPMVTVTQPTCTLSTGSITITSPLGAGLSYSIDGVDYTNTTGVFTGLVFGNYSVTVKNANGCISTATIVSINNVTVPTAPAVTVTQPTCALPTGTITVTSPLGAGLTYSIDGVDYTNTTGIFTTLIFGSYNVTIKNADGCISTATAVSINNVNAPVAPTATATQPATCTQPTGEITVTAPVGAGYSYSIDGVDYSNTTGLFTGLAAGSYNVTVKNANGCISAATVVVVVSINAPAAPVVTVVQPTCAVSTGSVTITSPLGAGLTYSIDGVDYSNTSGVFSPLNQGSYSVTVKNANGCISAATNIAINPALQVPSAPLVTVIQPSCNSTGSLTVTSPLGVGLSYSINGVDYTNTTGVFTSLAAATYNVTVKNADGCFSAATVVAINGSPSLQLSLTVSPVTISGGGENVTFTVTGNIPFTVTGWKPVTIFTNQTATTQNVFVNYPGPYSVSGISSGGCTDTASVLLSVRSNNDIYVPNAFTPDKNGINDILYVYGHSIAKLSMKIFNQWGEMVFETNDQSKGWDGSYKGRPQSTTVFAYALKATFINGEEAVRKGTILLIR